MSIQSYFNTTSSSNLSRRVLRLVACIVVPFAGVATASALTDYEADQITFMKEEEKLARDVYDTLGSHWDLAVFSNIARSEQTHMDRMDTLLVTYGLPDPAQPGVGVFQNPVLQLLYDRLVATGSVSMRAALGVGEMIEITDIRDLTDLIEGTELADVIFTADRLRSASYNHLASFRSQLALLPPEPTVSVNAQMVNLSARGPLGEGDESLIVGFIIEGDTPLQVLLTTRGTSLAQWGVGDYATNPSLQLFSGSEVIASNDDWGTAIDATTLTQHAITALDPTDAGLLISLPPGAYTVISANNGTGRNGLAEIFALPTTSQQAQLRNLSVRGKTEPGYGRLIAGVIVQGDTPLPLLVRALGPTLTSFGVEGTAIDLDLIVFDPQSTETERAVSDWLSPDVLGIVPSNYWPETPLEPMTHVATGPGAVTIHAVDPIGNGGITLIDVTVL